MVYAILDNVPMPPQTVTPPANINPPSIQSTDNKLYPIAQMKPGQSFFMSMPNLRIGAELGQIIAIDIPRWNKETGFVFKAYKVTYEKSQGIEVWRIK